MYENKTVTVIIPALNEETNIAKVVSSIPKFVDSIIVVDNGSTDATAQNAQKSGATIVREPRKGYGYACLAGINEVARAKCPPEVVVFVDGDFADDPQEMSKLVDPIACNNFDFVIGSRTKGKAEKGSLSITQIFGNQLSCFLTNIFFGFKYSDLGPFRSIRWTTLQSLKMNDTGYGWTIQMQVRAAKKKIGITEVPVNYKQRLSGKSKVSGSIRGVIGAGSTILYIIFSELAKHQVERLVNKVQTKTT